MYTQIHTTHTHTHSMQTHMSVLTQSSRKGSRTYTQCFIVRNSHLSNKYTVRIINKGGEFSLFVENVFEDSKKYNI